MYQNVIQEAQETNPLESRTRLKDASAALNLYRQLVKEDDEASKDRAEVEAVINGGVPYTPAELQEFGRESAYNLNFGDLKAAIQKTCLSYYDLFTAAPGLVNITVEGGQNYAHIIAEVFSELVKKRWTKSSFVLKKLVQQFVKHGVAFAYNPDEDDFRFDAAGLKDFKTTRGVEPHEDCFDVVFLSVKYSPSKLYSLIKDLDDCDCRWDVEAVRDILVNSVRAVNNSDFINWEQTESSLKQNDLYWGSGEKEKIELIYAWWKEYDGSITQAILHDSCDKFIYRLEGVYESFSDFLTVFTFDIGDGTLHSIRGQGYDQYPFAMALNSLRNTMLDGASDAMTNAVQLTQQNQSDQDSLVVRRLGNNVVLPAGVEHINRQLGDFSRTALPVTQSLEYLMEKNTTQYSGIAPNDGRSKTKAQWMGEVMDAAALSTSAYDLFYESYERLIQRTFKRVISPVLESDKDSSYKLWFRQELLRRGVPTEALEKITKVQVVRASGLGSPAARQYAFDTALGFIGYMDDAGRYNLVRDKLADMFGAQISSYMPPMGSADRHPVDFSIAQLENAAMLSGQIIQPKADDNHYIHAGIHFSKVDELLTTYDQNPDSLAAVVQTLAVYLPHLQFHVERMSDDFTRSAESAQYRKLLNNVGAEAQRMRNELEAAMINEQKQIEAEAKRQQDALEAHISGLEQQIVQQDDLKEQRKLMYEQAKYQARVDAIREEARIKLEVEREKQRMLLAGKETELMLAKINAA